MKMSITFSGLLQIECAYQSGLVRLFPPRVWFTEITALFMHVPKLACLTFEAVIIILIYGTILLQIT